MPDPDGTPDGPPRGHPAQTGHRLGPHIVGQRVVVRRLLPGQTGPSGGPAMTDLLGELRSWGAGVAVVATDRGEESVPIADIVTGKPVPARPDPRLRVPVETVQRRAVAAMPPQTCEPLGDWLLRDHPCPERRVARLTSALAVGDPGMPLAQAVTRVQEWYAARPLTPWASVVAGSLEEAAFTAASWQTARPGEGDTEMRLAGVAGVLRRLRGRAPNQPDPDPLEVQRVERADGVVDLVVRGPHASGRCSVEADWAGVTDVQVDPEHRRSGLAHAVLSDLLAAAAEEGATTTWLQVRSDNPAAVALYDRLGYALHHTYRYLTPAPHH